MHEHYRLTRSALRPDRFAPLHFSHRFSSTTCNSDGSRPSSEAPGISLSTKIVGSVHFVMCYERIINYNIKALQLQNMYMIHPFHVRKTCFYVAKHAFV